VSGIIFIEIKMNNAAMIAKIENKVIHNI